MVPKTGGGQNSSPTICISYETTSMFMNPQYVTTIIFATKISLMLASVATEAANPPIAQNLVVQQIG